MNCRLDAIAIFPMKMIFSKQPVLLFCSCLCVSGLFVSCGEEPSESPKEPTISDEKVSVVAPASQAPKVSAPESTPDKAVQEVEPEPVGVDATDVAVVAEKKMSSQELKELRSHPWELEDLKDIRVRPGEDSPKVGDTIYAMKNVPTGKCGEFWVQDPSGYVSKLAVCSADPNDENHKH